MSDPIDPFHLCDDLGPAKVVHISVPAVGLRAIVVIDNVAAGPAIGGTRMAPDAGLVECARLARAMTLKNVAAGLAHGGAKSVIIADPKMDAARKERLLRAFATAIEPLADYIPGPDMGTDEQAMAFVHDEIGRAAGLPRVLGGIPLDEIGATGLGVAVAAAAAREASGVDPAGARVVIEGFGAVGRHAARFLADEGAHVVAVADSRGAVADENGLDLDRLEAIKSHGGSVTELSGARVIAGADLVAVPCDIWIPAARPDVIDAGNVDRLQCRLVLQGANIPVTRAAEARLHERGIVSVPDFIANAGGVICAAVELARGSQDDARAAIREKVAHNTAEVLARAAREGVMPREAGEAIAHERLAEAMRARRWH
ncbi:MAG: Glu/Leu/Phe/Val dehydrogenase [Hyphomicrobiaceae bacterium]